VQGGREGWCVRWHFFSLVDGNIIAIKSRDTAENNDLLVWKEFIGSWFSLMSQIIADYSSGASISFSSIAGFNI